MNRIKSFLSLVKAHPVAFLVGGALFAIFLASTVFALVNSVKKKIPGGDKIPDLGFKSLTPGTVASYTPTKAG